MSGSHRFWVYTGQWTRSQKIIDTMTVHNISLEDFIDKFHGGHVTPEELVVLEREYKVSRAS